MNLELFKIGESKDWKFGVITREVYRVSENKFEIHDLSSGWQVATVNKKQMNQLMKGKLKLSDLDFK